MQEVTRPLTCQYARIMLFFMVIRISSHGVKCGRYVTQMPLEVTWKVTS